MISTPHLDHGSWVRRKGVRVMAYEECKYKLDEIVGWVWRIQPLSLPQILNHWHTMKLLNFELLLA